MIANLYIRAEAALIAAIQRAKREREQADRIEMTATRITERDLARMKKQPHDMQTCRTGAFA